MNCKVSRIGSFSDRVIEPWFPFIIHHSSFIIHVASLYSVYEARKDEAGPAAGGEGVRRLPAKGPGSDFGRAGPGRRSEGGKVWRCGEPRRAGAAAGRASEVRR